jgi:hypothetical protein
MAYTRNATWANGSSGATPITATKLNLLEDGLVAAADIADTASATATSAASSASSAASAASSAATTANNAVSYATSQSLTSGQKTQARSNIGLGDIATQNSATFAVSTLKAGATPQSAYTVEMGQDNDGIVSDMSFVRIRTRASRGSASPASFFGETALRLEIEDTASVVGATTASYLYGLRVRAVPAYGRNQSGVDDLVGVCITNQSYTQLGTSFNGTEALYVGYGGGSTGGASKDWNAGVGIDTVADNGMYIVRGPYAYGILMTASFSTAAIRIPNNSLIVARNAANSANVNVVKLDTSNNVRLGSSAIRVIVGAPTNDTDPNTPFEIHSGGGTDGNLGHSHQKIVDTTAFAVNVGGALAFAGYTDATPTIRSFGAITGRKANATSGNAGGYLSLWSRHASNGLIEVLRLTETQMIQVTDASNIVLGSTTGTQIGTATTQKLALYGKTPIVQPTTAVAAAAFVVGSGTAVNDASTFGGYTIKQIVQALQNIGVLA